MGNTTVQHLKRKRYLTYWMSVVIGYVFPFVYFFVKMGVQKQATKLVMPTLIAGILLVIRLARDLPQWTAKWRPSFAKGLLLALPKIILFIILLSIGALLEWIITEQIEASFYTYFETIIVLFGGQAVGAVAGAFHLKYQQIDMMQEGYVLGVINK